MAIIEDVRIVIVKNWAFKNEGLGADKVHRTLLFLLYYYYYCVFSFNFPEGTSQEINILFIFLMLLDSPTIFMLNNSEISQKENFHREMAEILFSQEQKEPSHG